MIVTVKEGRCLTVCVHRLQEVTAAFSDAFTHMWIHPY